MNVLVLYQSRNGHTHDVAEAIADVAEDQYHSVKIKSVIEVHQTDVDRADVVFVGTWVHGLIVFGVRPAEAELWVPRLPSLEGKPVGIYCTYAFSPRHSLDTLAEMLVEKGAIVVGQQAFHRNRTRDGADQFVNRVLQFGKRELA